MGRCVIMLDGKFMEWTSVSDGPASLLLTESQFRRYWREEYGRARWHELAEILILVKKYGTSTRRYSVNDIIKDNRAGTGGKKLTKKQIIDIYAIGEDGDFETWCKNRDAFAEKQFKEWEEIFTEREKRG